MLMTASVHAVIYTVTNNNDSGPGSFRQALLDADASGGNDYINFQDVGTITKVLRSPLMPIPLVLMRWSSTAATW
jgi:hypothetical protein